MVPQALPKHTKIVQSITAAYFAFGESDHLSFTFI